MTTPAGWYPDPNAEGTQRYWDGDRWTEHTAPAAPSQPAATTAHAGPAVAPLATEDTPTRSGGRGKLLGGVAAGALVLAAGAFAVTQMASADGGADSPEAAVGALFDAAADEDLVGLAEIVLPGERRTYVDPMLEGIDHLQRWGVLDDSLDTSDVDGFDIEFDGLELRTEPAADDVVNVFASGTAVASVDGEELPIGSLLEDEAMNGADPSQLDAPPERGSFQDVMITAVRHDGGWYVSALYTLAENARAETGMALPSPGEAIQPVGADSPEAAVDGLLSAVEDLDLEALVARLNPDEAQVLQRYAPLFLAEGQAEIDAAVAESGLAIEIDDVEYDVVRRDGIAVVTPTSMSLRLADGSGEEVSMTWDGDCMVLTAEGETEEACASDQPQSAIDLTDTPIGDVQAMLDDMDELGLVVAESGGQWYVSPIRSYSEAILAVMRIIDREHIERLIDSAADGSLELWFEEQFEEMLGGLEVEGLTMDDDALFGSTTLPDGGDVMGGVTGPSDADLDDLVEACEDGDMSSCDELWWSSSIGSEEERIAETCGDTLPAEPGGTCEERVGTES